jgi:hypothetical protein
MKNPSESIRGVRGAVDVSSLYGLSSADLPSRLDRPVSDDMAAKIMVI